LGIAVHPNPTTNTTLLTLANDYTGVVQVRIIDANGKSFKELRLVKNTPLLRQSLSLAGLPKGTYLVSIQAGTSHQVKQIVKL
jgi:hypothetical protein